MKGQPRGNESHAVAESSDVALNRPVLWSVYTPYGGHQHTTHNRSGSSGSQSKNDCSTFPAPYPPPIPTQAAKGHYSTELYTKRATDIISQHPTDEPLFLLLSQQSPHSPAQVQGGRAEG